MVVGLRVAGQRGRQLSPGLESGLSKHLADASVEASVEALDPAVGLRVARRDQPVLCAQAHAAFVKFMPAAGLFALARESIPELAAVVGHQPGIDQASLAATFSFDRATIGGVIDRLEQKGLVARVVSVQDRRARLLHLTPEGEQLQAASRPVVEALQAEILSPLSPAERSVFLTLAQMAQMAQMALGLG